MSASQRYRSSAERWQRIATLVRRIDRIIEIAAYLDVQQHKGLDRAIHASEYLERLEDRISVEATRCTVEAAEGYLLTQQRKQREKGATRWRSRSA